MEYSVIIVAAGTGTRMNLGYNKMLYQLKNHMTVLETTVAIFENDQRCKQIIVVCNAEDQVKFKQLLHSSITFVIGGDTRQASVHQGLQEVNQEYVLIHDGARPFLPKQCIDQLLITLEKYDACLLCVPMKDTIKKVVDGKVIETYDRQHLRAAQTPQAFKTSCIQEASKRAKKAGVVVTDDAQLIECCGDAEIKEVMGSYDNIKITTIEDIR